MGELYVARGCDGAAGAVAGYQRWNDVLAQLGVLPTRRTAGPVSLRPLQEPPSVRRWTTDSSRSGASDSATSRPPRCRVALAFSRSASS